MSGYLLSIIGTVLLSAILTAILPEGKTAATVKNIAKIACLVVIVSPVLGIFRSLSGEEKFDENSEIFFSQTVIQTDEEFIKYYSEMRIQNAQAALQEELFNSFSVETDVTLFWEYTGEKEYYNVDKIKITKIYVKTENQTHEEDERAMWEYLTKNYCSEVLIE